MKPLDEQIADIEKLDELRQRARGLQQDAIEALTQKTYVPRLRKDPENAAWEEKATRANWALPGDDVEKAEMLQALALLKPKEENNKARWDESRKALIGDLKGITYQDCIETKTALDTVPIFRCAQVLKALARTPGHVLSEAALACFYRVVQELNEIASPAWTSAAARASLEAVPTAFITGECVRALLALEEALLQTARAAEMLGKEAVRASKFRSDFELWRDQEEEFRARSLRVSLAALKPQMIIDLEDGNLFEGEAQAILDKIEQTLRAVSMTLRRFPDATFPDLPNEKRPDVAKPEDRLQDIVLYYFAGAANVIAFFALKRLVHTLCAPIDNTDPELLGTGIAEKLKNGAQIVRDLLQPAEQFGEAVIDRELAAHSAALGAGVDGAELAFAATFLGLVSGNWKRPKVKAAYEVLHSLLSVHGRLRSIRPFNVHEKGYRLNVQTLEVTRRLADLVGHLDVEPEPQFVERLMLPFEYTRVPGVKTSESGWTTDPPGRNSTSLWWLTATAVDALESVIRMLDAVINRRVLQHFQVRKPSSLKLDLDELFYPDFGFAACCKLKNKKTNNIAVKLQQLRAHAGIGAVETKDRLFSLILYGPPGTGKSTLVEAVAKSAGVPLVEVTPSDILVGGVEGVERRTRHVFQALSKLTHAVILFDEFDSILLDRAKRNPDEIPRSVIEFLTPGMLPKLKSLNEASKEQRISFVLATNFVDRLDAAVTRGGRFDDRHGIYPPDVVSRLGRLLDQLKKRKLKSELEDKIDEVRENISKEADPTRKDELSREQEQLENNQQKEIPAQRFRVLTVVNDTKSSPMDKLGKPGWYTAAREKKDLAGTSFGYVLNNWAKKDVVPEAEHDRDKKAYELQRARRENKKPEDLEPLREPYWTDWEKIATWDQKLDEQLAARTDGSPIPWTEESTPAWNIVFDFIAQRIKDTPA